MKKCTKFLTCCDIWSKTIAQVSPMEGAILGTSGKILILSCTQVFTEDLLCGVYLDAGPNNGNKIYAEKAF